MSFSPHADSADATAIAEAVRTGALSAFEICRAALHRVGDAPGAFCGLEPESALAQAAALDRRARCGDSLGPLAGVPIAVKDNIDVAGVETAGGLPSSLHVASQDATLIASVRRADGIVLAKAAMDPLGWSMEGRAADQTQLANPAAPGHLIGGSSGGSAAAVAAGVVPLALGTDTAGSVRVPAGWSGVIALKPTHGLLDLGGVLPLAPSLDTVGVLSRSLRDLRLFLAAVGHRPGSAGTAAGRPSRIGTLAPTAIGDADPAVAAAYRRAVEILEASAQEVVELSESPAARGLGTVVAAEFGARWDPVLRGRAGAETELRAGAAAGAAIDLGDYRRALRALQRSRQENAGLFDRVDLLVLPVAPIPAPRLGEHPSVRAASCFTRAVSALGWPAVVLRWLDEEGRPLGLQLVGPSGRDLGLLGQAEGVARELAEHLAASACEY